MASSFGWDSSISGDTSILGYGANDAVVMDVVTNEEHSLYRTYLPGTIFFKYLKLGASVDGSTVNLTALPLDTTVGEYPLIGEVVNISSTLNKFFYTRRIFLNNKLQISAPASIAKNTIPLDPNQYNESTQLAIEGHLHHSGEDLPQTFENENYEPRDSLHLLKHFDGDVVLQNRYGATLRFGSSQSENALNQEFVQKDDFSRILGPTKSKANDPIIIMRVGERENPIRTLTDDVNRSDGLVVEDINRDDSSFVLSSNQLINFHFSTSGNPTYFRSSQRLPNKDFIPFGEADPNDGLTKTPLSGKLSLLNSDTLVLNSKEHNIILSANQDVISLSNRDTIFDAGEDFIIGAKQIYLMAEESSEPFPTIASRRDTEVTGTVAIAEQVIEMFTEVLELLIPTFGFGSPYQAGATQVIQSPGAQKKKQDIINKLYKIKSNLVRIQK